MREPWRIGKNHTLGLAVLRRVILLLVAMEPTILVVILLVAILSAMALQIPLAILRLQAMALTMRLIPTLVRVYHS